jgi:hypothetical protein
MARAAREHGKPDAAAVIVDDILGWTGGGARLDDPVATPRGEPPEGSPYLALAPRPAFHLMGPELAMRQPSHRPRRPVVVDGAVWE